MSPLPGFPIVPFNHCLVDFAAWSFLSLLVELMEQNIGIILVIEKEYSVVPGPEFPYVFFRMLCDVFTQTGSMIRKQLDILRDLFVLNSGVFVC